MLRWAAVTAVLHCIFSMYIAVILFSREKSTKRPMKNSYFVIGENPSPIHLPLGGRREKYCQDVDLGTSEEQYKWLWHCWSALHRSRDCCTVDLAPAEGHSVFEGLVYCTVQVGRNQEGNCYVSIPSLYCLQDTRGDFWLNVLVVEKTEPAQLRRRVGSTEFGHSKYWFPCWLPHWLHLLSTLQWQLW